MFRNNLLASLTDNGSGTITTNNILATDPLFKNAAGNDFRPRHGSPAFSLGVDVGIGTDFVGAARGPTFTAGAYQLAATAIEIGGSASGAALTGSASAASLAGSAGGAALTGSTTAAALAGSSGGATLTGSE